MTQTPMTQTHSTPSEHIQALNQVFGKHPARASHAKGTGFSGIFTPSTHQLAVPLLQQKASVIGRFSVGGGNPAAPDNAKTVRGMAFQISHGDQVWEAALISAPHFFARTPDEFVAFLKARTPQADGKPDAAALAAFNAAHPHTMLQAQYLGAQTVPKSWGTECYWSCNTFWVKNSAGQNCPVRWHVTPANGREGLSDEEAAAAGTNFLNADLTQRLAKQSITLTLQAQMGLASDSTTDPTAAWPSDRVMLSLGSITIEALSTAGDTHMFIPTVLPTGITPTDDPILLARAAAYQISLAHRQSK